MSLDDGAVAAGAAGGADAGAEADAAGVGVVEGFGGFLGFELEAFVWLEVAVGEVGGGVGGVGGVVEHVDRVVGLDVDAVVVYVEVEHFFVIHCEIVRRRTEEIDTEGRRILILENPKSSGNDEELVEIKGLLRKIYMLKRNNTILFTSIRCRFRRYHRMHKCKENDPKITGRACPPVTSLIPPIYNLIDLSKVQNHDTDH